MRDIDINQILDPEKYPNFVIKEDGGLAHIIRDGRVVFFMSSRLATPETIWAVLDREMNR